jgi:hypothetical protein
MLANGGKSLQTPDFNPVPAVMLFTPDAGRRRELAVAREAASCSLPIAAWLESLNCQVS